MMDDILNINIKLLLTAMLPVSKEKCNYEIDSMNPQKIGPVREKIVLILLSPSLHLHAQLSNGA